MKTLFFSYPISIVAAYDCFHISSFNDLFFNLFYFSALVLVLLLVFTEIF